MASCSSEIDTNDSNVTNSKDATEHYVSITPSSAETRSTVNPYGLSEFEKGDLFLVYDITDPHGFEIPTEIYVGFIIGKTTWKNV